METVVDCGFVASAASAPAKPPEECDCGFSAPAVQPTDETELPVNESGDPVADTGDEREEPTDTKAARRPGRPRK